MKLRRAEDRGAGPVTLQELTDGDKVEYSGRLYVIRPSGCDYHAFDMDTGNHTNIGAPIYRIHNIRQFDNGGFTWDRVASKPKPVTLQELADGDEFTDGHSLMIRRARAGLEFNGFQIAAIRASDCLSYRQIDLECRTLHRARIISVDDDGTKIWEPIT